MNSTISEYLRTPFQSLLKPCSLTLSFLAWFCFEPSDSVEGVWNPYDGGRLSLSFYFLSRRLPSSRSEIGSQRVRPIVQQLLCLFPSQFRIVIHTFISHWKSVGCLFPWCRNWDGCLVLSWLFVFLLCFCNLKSRETDDSDSTESDYIGRKRRVVLTA